jgi:hypothetical protein
LVSPQNPIRGQAKLAQYLPERLARVDRIQELLAHFDGQAGLRSHFFDMPSRHRFAASRHCTQSHP